MEMTLEQAEKKFVLRRKHGKIHIKKYIGSGEKVVIPRYIGGLPVTKIDSWALSAMTYDLDVNEIVIPDTVRYIGSAAFDFCKSLKKSRSVQRSGSEETLFIIRDLRKYRAWNISQVMI